MEAMNIDINKLSTVLQNSGVVGAGGAGFPTYVKLDKRAETIIMNCAECEPLLKLHRQLLEIRAYEILQTFSCIADLVEAKEAIIGIKKEYKATIVALNQYIEEFPKVKIHLLDGVYPMGDEVVLIYEATKKVVKPGGLPIEEGIAVFNVETIYNVYKAVVEDKPVTDKYVSVVAEVNHPVTLKVPLGTTIEEVVELAGGATIEDPAYLVGGPMMGRLQKKEDVITKTTNAILVLDKNHLLIQRQGNNASISMKRAASICCQCSMCSDLCPRTALGHPVNPHLFMRAAANEDFQDLSPFLNTLYCSACGVCELYACPQSLAPRTLMAQYKGGLQKNGIRPEKLNKIPDIDISREYRKVPEERLEARLGLSKYNEEAPLKDERVVVKKVRVKLSQHIGAPAISIVESGDLVEEGQMIAKPNKGLSVAIHAPISGKVIAVDKESITITRIS